MVWAPLAGAQVTVTSTLQPGVLKLGQAATWIITARGATSGELQDPEPVDGLRFGRLLGPDVSQSISRDFKGRVSQVRESTWRIEVQPLRLGEFELPRPRVLVGGQEYRGEARGFEVFADLKGSELGLFRYTGAPARLVEGQPSVVELVFGWLDSAASSINYANLSLPWWDSLPGAISEPVEIQKDKDRVEILINRRQRVVVERMLGYQADGQRYVAFRLPVLVTPTRPGELSLSESFLEFGEVVEDRSFFGSRSRLLDPYFIKAEPLAIEVRPLPKEGQPFDFRGAIGRFELLASASQRDLKVGDTVKLTLDLQGSGNLSLFQPPEPDVAGAFRGFQYYGFKEDKRVDRRRIEYDLVPLDTGLEVLPALELPYFDPESWSYRRLSSEPIPIRVRPLEGATPLEGETPAPRFADDLDDIEPDVLRGGGWAADAPQPGMLMSLGLGLLVGWLALRSAARQGGRDPGALSERLRSRALHHLERALRTSLDPESDLNAWVAFLGARTQEPSSAWIGRDLGAWAKEREAGGLPVLSRQSLDSLKRIARGLESASYGGRGKRVSRDDLLSTAKELLEDGL